MDNKILSQSNAHLQNLAQARRNRVRSLASSTAIETGKSIHKLEQKINHLYSEPSRVKLA